MDSSEYARVVLVFGGRKREREREWAREKEKRREREREKEEKTKDLVGNFFSPQMSLSVPSFKFAKARIETGCRQKENNIFRACSILYTLMQNIQI